MEEENKKNKLVAHKKIVTDKDKDETITVSELLFEWAGAIFTALIVVLLILTFFVRQVTVSGGSMNDTLKNDDRLLVTNFMYTPKNGDIVIISHGSSYSEPIVKRVIAVGGQRLDIDYFKNEVSVDGVLLHEDYIKGRTIKPQSPIKTTNFVIPDGYVFVMGDNRENSTDSRSVLVDIVPVQNIMGKAFFRLFPSTQPLQ